MARRQQIVINEDVSANLIAMIDIMFLLLLFFMLGADMTQREMAELVLPNADQVQEQKKEKASDDAFRATVNIHHVNDSNSSKRCQVNAKGDVCREMDHWLYVVRSQEFTFATIKDHVKLLADAALDAEVHPVAGKRMSKAKVIVRADKYAPYGHIQHLITLCGLSGIYMIEVGAAKPPVEKQG